jgi:hypothetical protein
MRAGKYNITVEQGATLDFDIVYEDSTGSAVDLTGYSAKMQLRPDYADLTNVTYLTISSSLDPDGTGLSITPLSGSINIYVSAEKTDLFTFDDAYYDLELYSDDLVIRLIEGKVKVKKSVTR